MTPDERRAIAARLEAATPGPWTWMQLSGFGARRFLVLSDITAKNQYSAVLADLHVGFPTCDFIAAAPTDIRALLAALDAADARASRLRAALQRFVDAEPTCDYEDGEPDVCSGIAANVGPCRWCDARAALEKTP